MRVLGIESSCDETGIAIYDSEQGLLAHALHSQIAIHQQYGGVVPELASRDHVKYLVSLTDEALKQAQLSKKDMDAIAYTAGPGLIGALLTGACFAKSLALALNIPALAIHHLEAHLLAAKLDSKELDFPFLALLVSGGHTQFIEAQSLGNYKILGETLDDAVGEAFDKTAKLMGLPYPGGAMLAALADQASTVDIQELSSFPRPMTDRPGLDFSFSGLKTHALTAWNASQKDERAKIAIAKAFQDAVVDTLFIKCKRALQQTAERDLVVAGGVGANKALRNSLTKLMQDLGGRIFFPRPEYCTDNGAMVAYAGCLHLLGGKKDVSSAIEVKARWPLA
ncbi:tRNA (adenosine(37)-N6)-threonylcarbamoyltransferase complex transferase subunit TsaD [Legionella jordanis]|uniref:tRNA N6-adenosine threonylcarbamoyltransferase n=1 Tax=Legionella jordanis TaxID=456 RepID=A0A0W0VB87_9GAMM|nr:tRNA (adenosine(37)-N6)-threonylcarbamoyltransferase complex transferase subunit TsaD [Legionella jordanis]KTD17386.1 O-sialoglycoprotein endopeptidase [Legionella jordanis]RMX01848.1 tRNA (adenosine(37)-N6)-threonylcarbamoyltransferase complex transferase subunit TsaD [Legionella jordanis]RMX17638.1 tRNA (adenosine(37)-N6)-threonylcarbamoyltransferase complex transferase subunit TsaD [Legionella jordanis]VEH11594.1 O-sialoglycoprotein endopeptidase [Legionella jordanis]HAT8714667.1 tRNA (a